MERLARAFANVARHDFLGPGRLADAFGADGCAAVRALRLAPDPPDATAWFAGDGWWLSTTAS